VVKKGEITMEKLIKIASFSVVLVMVVVSFTTAKSFDEAGPVFAVTSNDKPENGAIVLIGVQQPDGSVNIVYLNPDSIKLHNARVWDQAVSMFPDALTIVLLGLAGLFYRRRPVFARASSLAFVKR